MLSINCKRRKFSGLCSSYTLKHLKKNFKTSGKFIVPFTKIKIITN